MIPVLVPSLPETDGIVPYLRRIDQSHTYSNYGPLARAFTEALCRFVSERAGGVPVAATITGDGTSAIELALRYRIADRRGGLCLMPAYTFIATAHAAVNIDLEPYLADVEPETLSLTPEIAERALAAAEGDIAAEHRCPTSNLKSEKDKEKQLNSKLRQLQNEQILVIAAHNAQHFGCARLVSECARHQYNVIERKSLLN